MGVRMDLPAAQAMSGSVSSRTKAYVAACETLLAAVNNFVHEDELKGQAYDSAKSYCETYTIPLLRGMISFMETLGTACQNYLSGYETNVDSKSWSEEDLLDRIGWQDSLLRDLANLSERATTSRDKVSINRQRKHATAAKAVFQKILDDLYAFNDSSPSYFSEAEALFESIASGLSQMSGSWDSGTKTYTLPNNNQDLTWQTIINTSWEKRQAIVEQLKYTIYKSAPVEEVGYKKKIDNMTVDELETSYGNAIQSLKQFNETGYTYHAFSGDEWSEVHYAYKKYQELVKKTAMKVHRTEFDGTVTSYYDYIRKHGVTPSGDKPSSMEKWVAGNCIDSLVSTTTSVLQTISSTYFAYQANKVYYDKVGNVNHGDPEGDFSNFDEGELSIDKTANSVEAILKQNGTTSKSFLNLTDADSQLTVSDTQFIREVRLKIGVPETGTRMVKVIPTKYVEGIVKPGSRYNTFSGFVSVDSHSASLKTLDEVFEGNRLDYQNTPYRPDVDETYAKINFTLDSKSRLDIPLREPKVGEYPFTGRGFTGSKEIVLPEYELRKGADYHYQHGDTIGIYDSKSGNLINQYIYDGEYNVWMQSK